MNQNHNTPNWQDEQALERYRIISPLTDTEIDVAKRNKLRLEIAENNGISVRTLYRWEKSFAENGYAGLKPMNREYRRSSKLPEDFDTLLAEAIQLKREVPTRSVNQIIYILEGEGRVKPGALKRSTVQRYLYRAGFGKKQMKKYAEGKYSSSKRFCKPHRMMLVQGDIKYGIMLPISPNGKKIMTYLSALIDDHSRMILSSDWYDNQEGKIVEDTFHKAILKYGKPDAFYLDYTVRSIFPANSARLLPDFPYESCTQNPMPRSQKEKSNALMKRWIRSLRRPKRKRSERLKN